MAIILTIVDLDSNATITENLNALSEVKDCLNRQDIDSLSMNVISEYSFEGNDETTGYSMSVAHYQNKVITLIIS